jgi:hypothetical protein
MVSTSPSVTAYRGFDDEPWRLERLVEVKSALPPAILSEIESLHDHKGCLSVNWRRIPASSEVMAVIAAWAEQNEITSNHYVNGEAIIEDVLSEWPPCP